MAKKAGKGQKAPSKSTIDRFLNPKAAESPAAPLPARDLAPLDVAPFAPDALGGLLSGFVRRMTTEAERLLAVGDDVAYQRLAGKIAQLAGTIQRGQAREEDGDAVRVPVADLAAAGERARSKIHDLIARLSEGRGR